MLVLTRTRDQRVIIGDDIEVTVVDIRGDKVRLGITAPRHVSVHRKEVYNLIRDENRKAAQMTPTDLAGVPGDLGAPPKATLEHLLQPEQDVRKPHLAGSIRQAQDPFLHAAIEEALKGQSEGGLPIGSVLVRGDQIIGRGHNRRVQKGDPMAHAEIDCLTNAGRQRSYRDTVLYSTLMPCFLCSGAAAQFGIPKVIVGESVNFAGAPDFMRSKGIDVVDLHNEQCIRMMGDFIRQQPELWNEDIGH